MPCIVSSNNRTLPPNARASDNAAFAVENIADVQQQKMMAAFRVQGVPGCIYHRLYSGQICSCQSAHKKINSRLDKDGKAPVGMINQLLQGGAYGVAPYQSGTNDVGQPPMDGIITDAGVEDPFCADDPDGQVFDVSGYVGQEDTENMSTLDEIVGEFDTTAIGITDVACPICYGTGFIGGFSLFRGFRKVIPCEQFSSMDGQLHIENSPFTAEVYSFSCEVVLPKGAVGIDCFRLLNNREYIAGLHLDGKPISQPLILSKCDGRSHVLSAVFNVPTAVTHIEIQLNLSKESSYIELPKLSKSSDRSLLETTEQFQVILSPDVPYISSADIIVESMWGKQLIVQDTTGMNTRNRQMFGHELNVRVIQPAELYHFLPARKRIRQQNTTTIPVLGNILRRP